MVEYCTEMFVWDSNQEPFVKTYINHEIFIAHIPASDLGFSLAVLTPIEAHQQVHLSWLLLRPIRKWKHCVSRSINWMMSQLRAEPIASMNGLGTTLLYT